MLGLEKILLYIFVTFMIIFLGKKSSFIHGRCASSSKDTFKNYKVDLTKLQQIAQIKKNILDSLGYEKRPMPPVQWKPCIVIERFDKHKNETKPETNQKNGTFYAEIEEFITFSEPAYPFKNENVIQFKVVRDQRGRSLQVKSANLLVKLKYKRRRKRNKGRRNKKNRRYGRKITLIISTVDNRGKALKNISTLNEVVRKTNWFNIRIQKEVVEKALASPKGTLRLHIRCKGCKKGAKLILVHGTKRWRRRQFRNTKTTRMMRKRSLSKTRPILILHAKFHTYIRNKRSIECNSQNSDTPCCKDNLLFSFAEQGWDDWVISPSHFNTGVCLGTCLNSTADNQTCKATRSRSLRITYYVREAIVTAALPNLIIDECGCSPNP